MEWTSGRSWVFSTIKKILEIRLFDDRYKPVKLGEILEINRLPSQQPQLTYSELKTILRWLQRHNLIRVAGGSRSKRGYVIVGDSKSQKQGGGPARNRSSAPAGSKDNAGGAQGEGADL